MFPWSWLLTKLPFLWFPLPTLNELMLEWEQAICYFGPWILRSWTADIATYERISLTTDYATSLLAYRKSGNTTTDTILRHLIQTATTLFFLSFVFRKGSVSSKSKASRRIFLRILFFSRAMLYRFLSSWQSKSEKACPSSVSFRVIIKTMSNKPVRKLYKGG